MIINDEKDPVSGQEFSHRYCYWLQWGLYVSTGLRALDVLIFNPHNNSIHFQFTDKGTEKLSNLHKVTQ